jgi:hypothetical protein
VAEIRGSWLTKSLKFRNIRPCAGKLSYERYATKNDPLTMIIKSDKGFCPNTEDYVLEAFERFFTFELYVRYIKSEYGNDLQKIRDLKEKIRSEFIQLNVVSELNECKYFLPEEPETPYPVYVELESLVVWALNSIQLSDCKLYLLDSDLMYAAIPQEVLDNLFIPFNKFNNDIDSKVKDFAYRFSDLFSQNDLGDVMNWWAEHTDSSFRKENRLLGTYGVTSVSVEEKKENGSSGRSFGLSPVSFFAPDMTFFRQNNYKIYRSNDSKIQADGEVLTNSIVLSVKFDKNFDNLEKILYEYLMLLGGAQTEWYYDQLNDGSYPGFYTDFSSPINLLNLKKISGDSRVLSRTESIVKNLVGLLCYDEYHSSKKEINLPDTAKEVLNKLKEASEKAEKFKCYDNDTIIKYYHDVRKLIGNINKIVENKRKERYDFHT